MTPMLLSGKDSLYSNFWCDQQPNVSFISAQCYPLSLSSVAYSSLSHVHVHVQVQFPLIILLHAFHLLSFIRVITSVPLIIYQLLSEGEWVVSKSQWSTPPCSSIYSWRTPNDCSIGRNQKALAVQLMTLCSLLSLPRKKVRMVAIVKGTCVYMCTYQGFPQNKVKTGYRVLSDIHEHLIRLRL